MVKVVDFREGLEGFIRVVRVCNLMIKLIAIGIISYGSVREV